MVFWFSVCCLVLKKRFIIQVHHLEVNLILDKLAGAKHSENMRRWCQFGTPSNRIKYEPSKCKAETLQCSASTSKKTLFRIGNIGPSSNIVTKGNTTTTTTTKGSQGDNLWERCWQMLCICSNNNKNYEYENVRSCRIFKESVQLCGSRTAKSTLGNASRNETKCHIRRPRTWTKSNYDSR